MKKITLFLLLLFTAMTVNAQRRGFVCTGDNVNVRTGPGKNYPNVGAQYGYKIHLNKGDVVDNQGKSKNGFNNIHYSPMNADEWMGWVSSQYLRPVIICPTCFGHKEDIDMDSAGDLTFNKCRRCKGKGYIK